MHRSIALVAAACLAPHALAHEAFNIAQQGDQLLIGFDFDHHVLLDLEFPGYPGWMTNEIPFEEADEHHRPPGSEPLEPGALIVLEVVLFDAGVSLRDPGDIDHAFDSPGQQFALGVGGTDFSVSPFWYLNANDYDPNAGEWHAAFRLVDIAGKHAPSETYTLKLVPAPGALGVLGLSGVALLRRRR